MRALGLRHFRIELLRETAEQVGPLLEQFELAFAEWVGCRFASAVSSGTAGLHLALRAVGVGDGDERVEGTAQIQHADEDEE